MPTKAILCYGCVVKVLDRYQSDINDAQNPKIERGRMTKEQYAGSLEMHYHCPYAT